MKLLAVAILAAAVSAATAAAQVSLPPAASAPATHAHENTPTCPTAPVAFDTANVSTAIGTLSVRFASESVARAPVVWYRLADALCVPHDALLIAAVRPADAAGEVRVDCARAPPAAECDVRARIRYALYLSEVRPATLQAIGVEALAPVTAATDAPTIADTNGSTSSPTAAAAASQVQRGAGSDDEPLLIGAFAVVCVLAVAVAAALVVCAVCVCRHTPGKDQHSTPEDKADCTSAAPPAATPPLPDECCQAVLDLTSPAAEDDEPPTRRRHAPTSPPTLTGSRHLPWDTDEPFELDVATQLSFASDGGPRSSAAPAALVPRRGDIFGFHEVTPQHFHSAKDDA